MYVFYIHVIVTQIMVTLSPKLWLHMQVLIFLCISGLEIFSIGYSYWNVAIIVCWKAVAVGWSLVPVLTGSVSSILWSILDKFAKLLDKNE